MTVNAYGERKEMGNMYTKFGMLSWGLAISNLGVYVIQSTLPPNQLCVMLCISSLSVFASGRSWELGTKFQPKQTSKA